jgi:hypothetical protein
MRAMKRPSHVWPVRTGVANLQAGYLQAFGRIALYGVVVTHRKA